MPPWISPERTRPAYVGDERSMLESWLDFHRATLVTKCAGLTGDQLVERSCPPSSLSLLGLVRHMAEVERGWFRKHWLGGLDDIYSTPENWDADFDLTDPARADEDLAVFTAELDAARAEAARHQLDETVAVPRRGGAMREVSLRWIYVHMIEEYARHNGHADLLRERIDGTTGD
jgi:uncharacterized damage-inducible protein DinB